jgi:alkylation response protein AidB-like acyl-CoA dehydrogenase
VKLLEDAEHRALRSAVRRYLDDRISIEQVRRFVDGERVDTRDVWSGMCRDLEIGSLAVPEAFGGLGAPWSFQSVVLEELGRSLAPLPYLSSILMTAGAFVLSGDDDGCRRWLPQLASGDCVGTLAAIETPGDWDLGRIATTARRTVDGRWTVTGRKPWVIEGPTADLALVVASTDAGPTLFAVELGDGAVGCTEEPVLDATRPLATLEFENAPATAVGPYGGGRDIVARTSQRAAVGLASEQAGGAAAILAMTTQYAKTRQQFGRPIGSFQAIKHLLADRLVENEALTATVRYAARAIDERPDELDWLAPVCQAVGSDAFLDAASVGIQVHGGIGFTWEHDAHLYFKRATASRQWLGTPSRHRERLAEMTFVTGLPATL